MHLSFCPRSASYEDPNGPYEEWVHWAAMEVVERIIIDHLAVLS